MIKIFFSQPWANDKNIATYYNEFMSLLPDDSYACFTDGDVMFLTSDYGKIIYDYIEIYPEAVLTCLTNRIACPYQRLDNKNSNDHNIINHKTIAEYRKYYLYKTQDVSKETYPMSGMMMVVKKSIWGEIGGFKGNGMLGVDNNFFYDLQAANKQILVMLGIYVYHQYRISGSKSHLL